MKLGIFCTYENPANDYRAAYADQETLVALIEALGFDEAWIAEHHFNPNAASPSVFPIIAHLAARTTRLRFGTATTLLPLHDPILVAEQAATTDILSNGRLNFGVAKGGPFDSHYKHFHLKLEDARPKTEEALTLIQKLLHEEHVSFNGKFFHADDITLTPKSVQRPLPIFVGTTTAETIDYAANAGFGTMAGIVFPIASIQETLRRYTQVAPTLDPRLVLLRFYHLAATREQALAEARAMLEPFVERMRGTTSRMQPSWTPRMVLDRVIEDSLIGTVEDVLEKTRWLQKELRPHSLALKPVSSALDKRIADLKIFAEKVLPAFHASTSTR